MKNIAPPSELRELVDDAALALFEVKVEAVMVLEAGVSLRKKAPP